MSSLSLKLKLPTKIYKISKLCGVVYDVLSLITGQLIDEGMKQHQADVVNEKSEEEIIELLE